MSSGEPETEEIPGEPCHNDSPEWIFEQIGKGMRLVIPESATDRAYLVWSKRFKGGMGAGRIYLPSETLFQVLVISARSLRDMPKTPFCGLRLMTAEESEAALGGPLRPRERMYCLVM